MKVWDAAIQKNEPTFTYAGKKMDTSNGQFI
jgi:phage terminase large subunit-like protein